MSDTERPACPLWAKIIATGGGVGFIPIAPGTWGSLTAICIIFGLFTHEFVNLPGTSVGEMKFGIMGFELDYFPIVILAFAFTVAGIIATGIFARSTGIKDPKQAVMDEFAGQSITVLGLYRGYFGVGAFLVAFLLFRLLDIWKPWPIRWFEKLPGGWGIMMDDVVAGLFGAIILAGLVHFRWLPGM